MVRGEALPLMVLLVLAVLSARTEEASSAARSVALPGCQERCGNVVIPYPFGIGYECYFNGNYSISCRNDTEKKEVPSLSLADGYGEYTVVNISLVSGQLRMTKRLNVTCGDSLKSLQMWVDLKFIPALQVSSTANKFTAVGCDIIAMMLSTTLSDSGQIYEVGCVSWCGQSKKALDQVKDGDCSGIGCCETSLPRDLVYYDNTTIRGINDNNVSATPADGLCGYGFIAEKGTYTFKKSDLTDRKEKTFQIVLDWSMKNQTCNEAQKDPGSYLCRSSPSKCVDSVTGSGYLCNCSRGYGGNPYLEGGCQDIDECNDLGSNPCNHNKICINTPGSYYCFCPPGQLPDNNTISGCSAPFKSHTNLGLILGTGMGSCLGFLLLLGGILSFYKTMKERNAEQLKKENFRRNHGMLLEKLIQSNEHGCERTKIFTLKDIEKATNNFDDSLILGKGGHGTVYKGLLSDKRVAAIKKSEKVAADEIKEFINEVALLSQISHRNVVKLFGCCLESEVPLLVYEHVNNRTLSDHLHGPEGSSSQVSWNDRLRIATEIVGAVSYLHTSFHMPIWHRDLKTANILLDENLTAKVSDFGASRIISIDQTGQTAQTAVQGTLGYLDPEGIVNHVLTEKSDVYSMGVILVELLTRKKPYIGNIVLRFKEKWAENKLCEVLDKAIELEQHKAEVEVVARLAKLSVGMRGKDRPTMKQMENILERLRNQKKCSMRQDNRKLPLVLTGDYGINEDLQPAVLNETVYFDSESLLDRSSTSYCNSTN